MIRISRVALNSFSHCCLTDYLTVLFCTSNSLPFLLTIIKWQRSIMLHQTQAKLHTYTVFKGCENAMESLSWDFHSLWKLYNNIIMDLLDGISLHVHVYFIVYQHVNCPWTTFHRYHLRKRFSAKFSWTRQFIVHACKIQSPQQ